MNVLTSLRGLGVAAAVILAAGSPVLSGATHKIGVIPRGRGPYWVLAGQGAQAAGRALGVDVIVHAPVIDDSVSVQSKLVDALVNVDHVEAIVICAVQPNFQKTQLAALGAKAIPVIAMGTPIEGENVKAFVGLDQTGMAEAAAKALAAAASGRDEVIAVRVNTSETNVLDRERIVFTRLRESNPKLVIHADVYGNGGDTSEASQVKIALEKYPKAAVMFTPVTVSTDAALKLLRTDYASRDLQLVGFGLYPDADSLALIHAGKTQWVVQAAKELGYKGVETALAVLEGRTPAKVINVDFAVLTKDNLDDPKVQALLNR